MELINIWLIVWFRSFGAISKTYYVAQLAKALIIAFIFCIFYHSLNILQTKYFLSISLKTLLFPYAWYIVDQLKSAILDDELILLVISHYSPIVCLPSWYGLGLFSWRY